MNTSNSTSINGLKLYVKDSSYEWLPAIVVNDETEDCTHLSVRIDLPDDWHSSTFIQKNSGIKDLEDENLHAGTNASPPSAQSQIIRTVSLKNYENKQFPLQNLCGPQADIANLPNLHEAAILYNLKARHAQQKPYTRVGEIVIAMNPFEWIPELYSSATQEIYAQKLIWQQQPPKCDYKFDEEKKDDSTPDCIGSTSNLSYNFRDSQYDKLGFEPHVYEISCLAYRGLALNGKDQTILVSGESGAGKTETVKIVLTHLATLELTGPDDDGEDLLDRSMGTFQNVVNRVIASSPVFEAFGNAQTGHNNNSSRFGRFIQLEFSSEPVEFAKEQGRSIPICSLIGSECVTYLIEKSRVVSHAPGERNYHIFYQLLSAPSEIKEKLWPNFQHAQASDFSYLVQSGKCGNNSSSLEYWSDEDMWVRTVEALRVFGIKDELLLTLTRALAIVLQIGNLIFQEDPETNENHTNSPVCSNGSNGSDSSVITSQAELAKLSSMIGIPCNELEAAMTCRIIKTNYEEVQAKLNPSVAKDACDALAKEIYAKIFGFLVREINEETKYKHKTNTSWTSSQEPEVDPESAKSSNPSDRADHVIQSPRMGKISLLDIFGFECFQVNRFQQLCINYANEQLQQKYVLDNFKLFKEEYEAEGVDVFDFHLVDNSGVVNLLEGRNGIIDSLNEECLRPMGNEVSFVYKTKITHKSDKNLIDEKLHQKTEFGIKHFAGPVQYDASKFVENNTDKLPEGLLACVTKTTNSIIRNEFQTLLTSQIKRNSFVGNTSSKKKKSNGTVLEKFRGEVRDLMAAMEDSTIRYIRCIKPNESMTPKLTCHSTTIRQLKCAGLITVLTLKRESFPDKMSHEDALNRFGCLGDKIDSQDVKNMDARERVINTFSNLSISTIDQAQDLLGKSRVSPFAYGKTKVFFRAGALEHLETIRHQFLSSLAIKLQAWVRKHIARQNYIVLIYIAVLLQSRIRKTIQVISYQRKRRAAIVVSAWVRRYIAIGTAGEIRRTKAATKLQTSWRGALARAEFNDLRIAAIVDYLRRAKAATTLQKNWRGSNARGGLNKLQNAEIMKKNAQKELCERGSANECQQKKKRNKKVKGAQSMLYDFQEEMSRIWCCC